MPLCLSLGLAFCCVGGVLWCVKAVVCVQRLPRRLVDALLRPAALFEPPTPPSPPPPPDHRWRRWHRSSFELVPAPFELATLQAPPAPFEPGTYLLEIITWALPAPFDPHPKSCRPIRKCPVAPRTRGCQGDLEFCLFVLLVLLVFACFFCFSSACVFCARVTKCVSLRLPHTPPPPRPHHTIPHTTPTHGTSPLASCVGLWVVATWADAQGQDGIRALVLTLSTCWGSCAPLRLRP